MSITLSKTSLITVGESGQYFNENSQPIDGAKKFSLKSVVIQETGKNPQLLVHTPLGRTALNAEAVWTYMRENEIQKIRINGGVHILFNVETKIIEFTKSSLAFGLICQEEVYKLASEIWPDYTIKFDPNWQFKTPEEDVYADGKIFTVKEVLEEVNKG